VQESQALPPASQESMVPERRPLLQELPELQE
jgi:hypothetical protein